MSDRAGTEAAGMVLTDEQARELAQRAVSLTGADQAEAVVISSAQALTRFANNRIHQNVAEANVQLSVRAVVGKRVGVAGTNRIDDESLRRCCEDAVAIARLAPEDPDFPGLPSPRAIDEASRAVPASESYGPGERGAAVASMIAQAEERGQSAAGKVEVNDYVLAVANSLGVGVAQQLTDVRATMLAMADEGGSGWASFAGRDASQLPAVSLGDEAALLADRSRKPGDLGPGSYAVVLGHEAVADLLTYLAYVSFSAKAFAEDRSFMSGHLGERLLHGTVTILDDALSALALGPTFDFEGQPRLRTTIIDEGMAVQPVTDSYWAAKLRRPNTGHALPAPNAHGPMPANLEMLGGDASIDELIASVDRGVYVTRFHYVNIEDPVPALLTGMTRDGTFLIEGGKLTRPLKNLRFTQSAVDALSHVEGITAERRLVGEEGASLVPALLIGEFAFTGQTA